MFKRNSNGLISTAELRHVFTNLGDKLTEEELDEIIRTVDLDVPGYISYKEFAKMMMSI